MSEKIQIEIEGVGAEQLKKQLTDIGREGTRVAEQIRKEFRTALRDTARSNNSSTNLARESQIAMNSFRIAERERSRVSRETERDIAASRRSSAEEAKRVARELAAAQKAAAQAAAAYQRSVAADAKRAVKEVSSVQAAAAQAARARRQSEAAAARATSAQVIAARRAESQADARFVAEEIRRAAGLRRARVREAQASAKQEAQARRDSRSAQVMGSRGMGLVMGAVGVFGVRQAISEFVEFSDSMMNARNRLRLVSSSQADAAQTMGRLKDVAISTRSDFDLVTRSYARTTNATRALGLSQSQNVSITQTLQRAIAVSGATNEEAHATLIQLTQAMASNRLSADEFRSVAEQLPVVLDMIAKATGKPRVELKKLGEDGRLTAAVLSYSFLKAEKEMAEAHAKMAPTIAQAWQNITTEATFALDKFNQASGASRTLTETLMFMSKHMSEVGTVIKTLAEMLGGVLVIQAARAGIALASLARLHPWLALLTTAPVVFNTIRAYRDQILDLMHIESELRVQRENNALGFSIGVVKRSDAIVKNDDGTFRKRGTTDENNAHLAREAKLRESREMMKEEARKEVMDRKLKALEKQAMHDINTPGKGKRGPSVPYQPTFADAVKNLEDETSQLSLRNFQRAKYHALMEVEDQLQRSMTQKEIKAGLTKEDIRVRLSKEETDYISNLMDTQKALRDQEQTEQALFKAGMERIEQIHEARKAWKAFADEYEQDQRRLGRDIKAGANNHELFPQLSSPEEFARADAQVSQGRKSGFLNQREATSARNQIEMQRPNATSARKQFLQEIEGMGKFKSDMDQLFGPDGTIATGFSSAIAHSLTFHSSFKKSIHDLGKTIQQEIIQTLIQGFIRMSILGLMGGGKATAAASAVLPPSTGVGRATGGYTGQGPRTGIAGYHHFGEFVVPAGPTQQNRDVLETISKGGRVTGGTQMKVTVVNQHGGVEHDVQQLGPNEVYIIAKRAVRQEADRALAASMNDANNPFSKQLRRNTDARIQR